MDVLILCATSEQLRDAVGETIALRMILSTSQALNIDPVAKRAFDDRLFTAEVTEKSLIQIFLEEPVRAGCHTLSAGVRRMARCQVLSGFCRLA